MENQTEKLPADMTLEEILTQRDDLKSSIEQIEAAVSIFDEELLERLNKEKVNGMICGKRTISKVVRISFSCSMEEAKELGAIKQSIDQDVLKKLHAKGVNVPGIKQSEYVMVRDVKQAENPVQ